MRSEHPAQTANESRGSAELGLGRLSGDPEAIGTKKPDALTTRTSGSFITFRRRMFGGSCGIRTYDQLVKSQLLYQLS